MLGGRIVGVRVENTWEINMRNDAMFAIAIVGTLHMQWRATHDRHDTHTQPTYKSKVQSGSGVNIEQKRNM